MLMSSWRDVWISGISIARIEAKSLNRWHWIIVFSENLKYQVGIATDTSTITIFNTKNNQSKQYSLFFLFKGLKIQFQVRENVCQVQVKHSCHTHQKNDMPLLSSILEGSSRNRFFYDKNNSWNSTNSKFMWNSLGRRTHVRCPVYWQYQIHKGL